MKILLEQEEQTLVLVFSPESTRDRSKLTTFKCLSIPLLKFINKDDSSQLHDSELNPFCG